MKKISSLEDIINRQNKIESEFGKVKSYTVIDPEKFNNLLNNFIKRSERWIEDAEKREDYNDVFYYKGQKDVIEELQDMINSFK
ncbi:hypothetical protein PQE75_gp140 [Bacillus phage vB_BcoS-136]|uniref:Uncharacterized protein n=1 Tax=Bacillus phage vB_BcoS-136 TaxID=2419619 RepID=A0A3G3BVN9_9CAUD|nr:hypothetical protein PQE75_gp140 [Bacillus phage vB_BcoS-136]AYP68339.1 hypothetical protein vBBcoS136_00225 [Bacillus phage vB_BcoS-136]